MWLLNESCNMQPKDTILKSPLSEINILIAEYYITKPVNSDSGRQSSLYVSVASRPAMRPAKQTAEAAAKHKQEMSSLNLNLSLQACLYNVSI